MPTLRKLQKAKLRRKDFELKRNVNRHKPKIVKLETKELFAPVIDQKTGKPKIQAGRPVLKVVGEKQVVTKYRNSKKGFAMMQPKRRIKRSLRNEVLHRTKIEMQKSDKGFRGALKAVLEHKPTLNEAYKKRYGVLALDIANPNK